jgi:membrane protease YdiL (CAAX protease family)
VRNCPACAAACPPGAQWCGQCYAVLDGTTSVATAVAPSIPPQATPWQLTTPPASRWQPSTPYQPVPGGRVLPPPPPPPPAPPPPANGMLDRRALLLVSGAIGIGAVGMALSWLLGRDGRMEPDTAIRYAVVITLAVYAVVGGLLVTQLTPRVRLTWRVGNPWAGGALGLAVGGGLGLVMLLAISGLAGHLSSDSRVVSIMSEGDAAHIGVAVLITVVCAPLVEEVLFRGLLLESLRTRGMGFGIWMSGIAFAVWHLNPAALRYYALMGALLGLLYVKRGLVCSMAAHAGFNGVLTVAAIVIVVSPGKTFQGLDVAVQAPSGWSQSHSTPMALSLYGPAGAWFGVETLSTPVAPDMHAVTARLTDAALTSPSSEVVEVDRSTVRDVSLPAGDGVELDVTVQGHRGHMIFISRAGTSVEVIFLSAGSLKAERDFPKMVASVRVAD